MKKEKKETIKKYERDKTGEKIEETIKNDEK